MRLNNALNNKYVLIAGGGSGIGLAVAKQAYLMGAKVIIGSRRAEESLPILKEAVGEKAEAVSFDVTDEKQTADALTKIGCIDHLVISVRPEAPSGPIAEADLNMARGAFETKYWGPLQLIQKACKQINSVGSITMTSGIAGEKVYPGASVMGSINGAVEALCKALAVELSPIRINAVSPGFVRPKPKQAEELAKNFPLKTLGEPEDIAMAYIYLMTHPYTTGHILVADGGALLA